MTLACPAQARPGDASSQRRLPSVLALSALVHLGLLVPLLLPQLRRAPAPPAETAVEVIEMPAPSPPKPPPPSKPPQESKPKPPEPERPKPAQAKPAQAKPAQAKPKQPEPKRPEPRDSKPDQAAKQAQSAVAERMRDLLGSMPAIVLPGASDDGGEVVSFKAQVLSQVGRAKKEGRHTGIPGIATVAFDLDERGGLARCEILRKSVDPGLDAEALAMVRRGVPYPVPPAQADRHFVVSLRFAAMP